MSGVVAPGGTLGVLGGGQLGRMFALAARQMGYRVHVFVPEADAPAGQVADRVVQADYLDLDAVRDFARGVDAVTLEFENVPAATLEAAGALVPARPGPAVLHIGQNRLREKRFLRQAGLPVGAFAEVRSAAELRRAFEQVCGSAAAGGVLKTAAGGYDGKGQVRIEDVAQAEQAWDALACEQAVLERWVSFTHELSVIVARNGAGELGHYGPLENRHRSHILDVSIAPGPFDAAVCDRAVEVARQAAGAMELEGLLCVEMFLCDDGEILVNELAPRTHNSGHLTIEGHVTSQFEQHVRATAGLPLGSCAMRSPAAMANLLGDVWEAANGEPDWAAVCTMGDVKVHLYGKAEPRVGRKMGHLTVCAETGEAAAERVIAARAALADGAG